MFAADVPTATPVVDPVPVILDAEDWSQLSAGLIQSMRLLDALYADLYGPRTVLGADVAPGRRAAPGSRLSPHRDRDPLARRHPPFRT